MTHMAVMVNLRAGIAPMDSQAWAVTASPTVRHRASRVIPFLENGALQRSS
jgi:hypothetical protein